MSKTGEKRWKVLQNGLRLFTDWTGEVGMGGPQTHCHVFSNGMEIGDGDLLLSPDGRYAASTGVRDSSSIMFADLEKGRVRCWSDPGDARRLYGASRDIRRFAACLQARDTVQYIARHGLWVPPDAELAPEVVTVSDPAGRPRLRCEGLFDAPHILAGKTPLHYLANPTYRVVMIEEAGERELPVHTQSPLDIVWGEGGTSCIIPRLPRYLSDRGDAPADGTHWLWRADGSSRWVTPRGWDYERSLASGGVGEVQSIDALGYELAIYMNRSADEGYSHRFRNLRSPSVYHFGTRPGTWVPGADERGRLVIAEPDEQEYDAERAKREERLLTVQQLWEENSGANDDGVVLSRPNLVPGAPCARFIPYPDGGDGSLRRYRVEVGVVSVEEVALFHLWSDCGRYLVLQPPVGRREVPDRFFLLDVATGYRLENVFRGCNVQLIGYFGGELQIGHVLGCVPPDYDYDPFSPVGSPPKPEDGGFLKHEWLLLECLRFRVENGVLAGPLPKSVDLDRPPYPNAGFDFYYHAPDRRRSVHVFGARNEYQDDYPREQCCRYQARAITSEGICLDQLGVGMLWSSDGRYLLVTTRLPPEHPDYDDVAWNLRVVDCEKREIYPEVALGCMPIFEGLEEGVIDYRRVDVDWWREDVDTHPARLLLREAMRGKPESLQQRDGLWFAPGTALSPAWKKVLERAYPA